MGDKIKTSPYGDFFSIDNSYQWKAPVNICAEILHTMLLIEDHDTLDGVCKCTTYFGTE